jgi:sugar lactone lactonase YvrE
MKRAILSLAAAGVLVAAVAPSYAVTTRAFRLTSYKDFDEGEAHGVVVSSLGEVASGMGSTRLDVPESVVYSSVVAPDGTVYLGTGDQGAIYVYRKGKVEKLVSVEGVLVSSLALGPQGTLFAGVMPGGRIYAIDVTGKEAKARELAKLDAEHVWGLAYDDARRTLYAATGPKGQLFAIDAKSPEQPYVGSRARVLVDTGEKHLLSLVRGDDGALYVGTADQALLFRVVPEGVGARLSALHDFEGEEVRAIARRGATLYVAVNEFTRTSATSTGSSSGPNAPKGTKIVVPASSSSSTSSSSSASRDRKGKGAVYRVDPDGRVEQLHAVADSYFTALHVEADGSVYAATGANGKVHLIKPDRTVLTAFDLAERQVLTMGFGPVGDRVLGTGDAGALYKVSGEPPKDAHYLSKVFDAQFVARFGAVRYGGAGALSVQTRSGNTAKPDKTWSAWAPLSVAAGAAPGVGRVVSPEARYIQVKVGFGKATTLRDLTLYYQPQNQRPRVTEITVGEDPASKKQATLAARGKPRSPIVKVKWKVENPDEDELVYRLFYREEGEQNWKPLGGPEPLTSTSFDWNTEPFPDGNYVLRVVASDERANPKEQALDHALVSSPYLIDNKKPELQDVQVAYPEVRGRARDSFSPVTELAYSVDGGDWTPFSPKDGVFDDPTEEFAFKLPSGLAPGAHSVAIRAVDAADNVGATQVTFRVR